MGKVAQAVATRLGTRAGMQTLSSDEYVVIRKSRKVRTPRPVGEGTAEGTAPKKPARPKKTA